MKSPNTGRTFTAAEEALVADGLPPFLIANAQERKAWWDKHPPRTLPLYFDPRLEADKELRAAHKREQTALRIFALRKSKGLIPDDVSVTSATQAREDGMPKYVIKPLDKQGHPVMRAVTSINDTATPEQIDEKVLLAVERGGSKVVAVTLNNTLREVILAWAVDEKGEVGPTDVGPYQTPHGTAPPATQDTAPASTGTVDEIAQTDAAPAEATQATEAVVIEEGSDMTAKKAKSKGKKVAKVKVPKIAKAAGAGGLRAGSKQEAIYNLLTRKAGCTTDEALKATGWDKCGVTTWGKKFGLKVTKEKSKDGTTRYYGA